MPGFTIRRDSSINNVPVVGYQDSADAQDIILWGAVQVSETGNTDANGIFLTQHKPIIDISHDWRVDGNGVPRERILDDKDITAKTSGGAALYIGIVDGTAGSIKLYTDNAKATVAANLTGVQVGFYTLLPVSLTSDGKINVELGGAADADSDPSFKVYIKDITGWHPVCVSPNSDTITSPYQDTPESSKYAPLAVAAFDLFYNGSQWQRKREPVMVIKKDISTSAGATTPFWTPAGGKRARLMKLIISNHATAPARVWLRNGTTGISADMTLPAQSVHEFDFGQGLLSSVDTALGLACNSGVDIGITAMGIEE